MGAVLLRAVWPAMWAVSRTLWGSLGAHPVVMEPPHQGQQTSSVQTSVVSCNTEKMFTPSFCVMTQVLSAKQTVGHRLSEILLGCSFVQSASQDSPCRLVSASHVPKEASNQWLEMDFVLDVPWVRQHGAVEQLVKPFVVSMPGNSPGLA